MGIWILIAVFQWGYGNAATTAIFHSKSACEKAADKINSLSGSAAYCFEDEKK